jgi:hypothetical protein
MTFFEIFCKDLEIEWFKLLNEGIDQYFLQKNGELDTTTFLESGKAILRLAQNKSDFELYVEDLDNTCLLSRHCIAIGVISDINTTIDVIIDSITITTLNLQKDIPQLIVMNKSILPLLALVYVQRRIIKHNPEAHIKVIYAQLNNQIRTHIARTSWRLEDTCYYIHGGVINTKALSNYKYEILPSIIEPWRRLLKKKIEWIKIIEEELIEKTWHPSRFFDWCLDIYQS